MELPCASNEQNKIIVSYENKNVIVDSVAGSGKTTTVLHIAQKYSNSKILLLTYNKRLKFETRNKVRKLNMTNIEVHSYHAFCCKYYDSKCWTDKQISTVLKKDLQPIRDFKYDYIIIDEAQDTTPIYYELILKIIANGGNNLVKILILGDIYQSIFDFNGSDERFIKYADVLFNVNKFGWDKTKLSTSFRLTKENADFLNNCVLKEDRILTIKNGQKPRYIICDTFGEKLGLFGEKNRIYEEIKYYLKEYKLEDIFVLAPSVKSERSPIRQLANKLSEENIPIYVPNNDDETLDDDILRGKIAFCTIHQTKGLERKVVIIFNFDGSYFKFYNKNANPNVCPNELYVALTRAIDRITVLHHYSDNYLEFLDVPKIKKFCYFEESIRLKQNKNIINKNKQDISVTNLIKHLSHTKLETALKFISVDKVKEAIDIIKINIKTQQDDLWENVSEITGTAIPSYYELKTRGEMTIYNTLIKGVGLNNIEDYKNNFGYMFIDDSNPKPNISEIELEVDSIDINNLTIKELLYLSNRYCAFTSGYNYKLSQIKNYDWLSQENLLKCCDRLGKIVSNSATFEKKEAIEGPKELLNKKLTGFLDCIDGNRVYEFKCVTEVKDEHFLQLALYAYLNEITNNKNEEEYLELLPNNEGMSSSYQESQFIKFTKDSKEMSGIITHIFGNGSINVRVNSKVTKINKKDIIEDCKDNNSDNFNFKYFLFNILTNEMFEIKGLMSNLKKLVEYLIFNKYFCTKKTTDDEFINLMKNIVEYMDILV